MESLAEGASRPSKARHGIAILDRVRAATFFRYVETEGVAEAVDRSWGVRLPRTHRWDTLAWVIGARISGVGRLGAFGRRLMYPLRHCTVHVPFGVNRGLSFNAAGSAPSFALGVSELAIQRIIAAALPEGGAFLDVGANVGFYTVMGSRLVGEHGSVLAIEPVTSNVAALVRNARLNDLANVTVLTAAASDRAGTLRLEVGSEPFWCSVREANAHERLVPDRAVVRAVVIDELLAGGSMRLPDVVKIDVEGFERRVIRGMETLLRERRPTLVCETDCRPDLLAEDLRRLGYSQVEVIGGSGSRLGRHVVAFDPGLRRPHRWSERDRL